MIADRRPNLFRIEWSSELKEGFKFLVAGILVWLIPNLVYKNWYSDYFPSNCDVPMFWSLMQAIFSVPLLIPLVYQIAFEEEKVNISELKSTIWLALKFSIFSLLAIYFNNNGYYLGRMLS